MRKIRFFGFCLSALLFPSIAYPSGFGIFVQGASAIGQADAVVAHAEDPSTIFFNPALINDLPGTQVEVGTTMILSSREFKSKQTGETEESDPQAFFPSTFYLTHAFNDKWSAGLGFFSPFGLGTDWGEDWEGRYLATESRITTFNLNPVVSYRINPRLSIAAGVAFLYLDADLKRNVNPALFGLSGLPDGRQEISGDGTGIGYNGGLLLKITDRLSFGASYRSEIDVDVDGEVKFNASAALSASEGKGRTEITLPQQAFAGIAYRFTDRLTSEIGVRWEGWSSYDELKIEIIDHPVLGTLTVPEKKNWHDTFTYNVGAKYRANEVVTLLAGYLYGKGAIPNRTFEPSIPNSDSHLFTVGTELGSRSLRLALSYGYQHFERRKKNNQVGAPFGANGYYRADLQMASASLIYKF